MRRAVRNLMMIDCECDEDETGSLMTGRRFFGGEALINMINRGVYVCRENERRTVEGFINCPKLKV